MSILEVDKRNPLKSNGQNRRLTWQQKFRKSLYHANYSKYFKKETEDDIFYEDRKNQAAYGLVNIIKESKSKHSLVYQRKQYYDPQVTNQNFYSPYSVFIPLEDESYMNDEIINTFSYMNELKDTGKREQLMNHYNDIQSYFTDGKTKGKPFVSQQWEKLKRKYICLLDSVKAVSMLIQVSRSNWAAMEVLYKRYGQPCRKEIFYFKVNRASRYIRSSLKVHQNLNMSVEVGDEINQKTLPLVMKTWYCPLCMCYDCEKHKLEDKTSQRQYNHVSEKSKKTEAEHIQNIIKLLKVYEELKNQSDMVDESQKTVNSCSNQCLYLLKKKDIPRVYRNKFKLISPLAKSLLEMGVKMFSYNPCQIHRIFQSKFETNGINCNQIFIHFTQECDLPSLIGFKMRKSEIEHLKNQDSKLINMSIKIPTNQAKIKRTSYQQKRQNNKNPQFAVCTHNFLDELSIDARCEDCVCRERGFCLPTCLCTESCQIRRQGCLCRGLDACQTQKCICFLNKMECQPGICGDCFAGKHQKKNSCRNDQILRQYHRKLYIGLSRIPGAGLGAFAGQFFNRHDLVCKYSGEHISSEVDMMREMMIQDLSFYNFDSPNGKQIVASIDARFMGNKARFINHANDGRQNLRADTIFSNGTQFIALFANQDIPEGEQLFFNYDGSGQLYKNHREKYPFILPPGRKC